MPRAVAQGVALSNGNTTCLYEVVQICTEYRWSTDVDGRVGRLPSNSGAQVWVASQPTTSPSPLPRHASIPIIFWDILHQYSLDGPASGVLYVNQTRNSVEHSQE